MEKNSNWKFINSIWIVFMFLGIFNWIVYLYLGFTSKSQKYTIIGFSYLAISFSFWFSFGLNLALLGVFSTLFCIIGYFFGIIYSFLNLPLYLDRLSLIGEISNANFENKKIRSMSNSELKNFVENNEFSANEIEINTKDINNIAVNIKKEIENSLSAELKARGLDTYISVKNEDEKIFINSASKEELLTIPEISSELAEKIISERKLTNGFKNMEEFEERLALKPHISKELEKKIIFNNTENIHENTSSNNNVRIVDF